MAQADFNPVILNIGMAEKINCWNYRDVVAPFARMYYVLDHKPPRARIVIDGKEYPLKPGKMYLIPPFVRHDELSDGPFSQIYLHIYDRSATESIFDQYDFPVEIPADDNVRSMFSKLLKENPGRQLSEYEPETYSGLDKIAGNLHLADEESLSIKMQATGMIYCLMSYFFSKAQHKQGVKDVQIRNSLTYINENLWDSMLSVDRLAEESSLSVNQYIRRFKMQTGTTPLQYIKNKRIEKAQVLLLADNATVKKVGLDVGFSDPAYFCRVFKEIVGMTPQTFKAKFN